MAAHRGLYARLGQAFAVADDALACAGIDLTLLDPFVQGLRYAADLGRDGLNGRPQGGIFATVKSQSTLNFFQPPLEE